MSLRRESTDPHRVIDSIPPDWAARRWSDVRDVVSAIVDISCGALFD